MQQIITFMDNYTVGMDVVDQTLDSIGVWVCVRARGESNSWDFEASFASDAALPHWSLPRLKKSVLSK